VTRTRRLQRQVLAAAACVALSACSVHPGAAAMVGSKPISSDSVDAFARALCYNPNASAGQTVASRAVRQNALRNLVNASLAQQYGEAHGIVADQGKVSAFMASNESALAQVPADRRSVLTQRLQELVEGQLILVEAGRRELQQQGSTTISDQSAYTAGTRLLSAWARKHVDVSVDPRFGTFTNGNLVPSSGSVSVAVSKSATAAAQAQPPSSWVAALPASQKCS
jgi:hypothetical protein